MLRRRGGGVSSRSPQPHLPLLPCVDLRESDGVPIDCPPGRTPFQFVERVAEVEHLRLHFCVTRADYAGISTSFHGWKKGWQPGRLADDTRSPLTAVVLNFLHFPRTLPCSVDNHSVEVQGSIQRGAFHTESCCCFARGTPASGATPNPSSQRS